MALRGHVFNKQLFSSECFALFIDTFLAKNSGIITGCEISNTTNSISVDDGYFCVRGRFLQEEGGSTINIEGTTQDDIYCKLVCEIDLLKENTTSELKQVEYKIIQTTNTYPVLQQQDITAVGQGNIYQFELAQFKITAAGIIDFIDKRTFLDFDSIYAEIRRNINTFLSQTNITTKEQIDDLIADLQEYCDTAKEILDENVAMNLLNMINTTKTELTTFINTKADKKKVCNITVDTNWIGTTAPYTKSVEVEGITEVDVPKLYPVYSETLETRTLEKEEYAKISMIKSSANAVELVCDEEKPNTTLNLRVEVDY